MSDTLLSEVPNRHLGGKARIGASITHIFKNVPNYPLICQLPPIIDSTSEYEHGKNIEETTVDKGSATRTKRSRKTKAAKAKAAQAKIQTEAQQTKAQQTEAHQTEAQERVEVEVVDEAKPNEEVTEAVPAKPTREQLRVLLRQKIKGCRGVQGVSLKQQREDLMTQKKDQVEQIRKVFKDVGVENTETMSPGDLIQMQQRWKSDPNQFATQYMSKAINAAAQKQEENPNVKPFSFAAKPDGPVPLDEVTVRQRVAQFVLRDDDQVDEDADSSDEE